MVEFMCKIRGLKPKCASSLPCLFNLTLLFHEGVTKVMRGEALKTDSVSTVVTQ